MGKVDLVIVMAETVNSLYRINNVALNAFVDINQLYYDIQSLYELRSLKTDLDESIVILEYKNLKGNVFDGLNLNVIDFDYLDRVMDEIYIK